MIILYVFTMKFTTKAPPFDSTEAGVAARRCCSAASWRWRAGAWQDRGETELVGRLVLERLERIIYDYISLF